MADMWWGWGGAVGKHHSEGDIGLDIKDESESSRQRDR